MKKGGNALFEGAATRFHHSPVQNLVPGVFALCPISFRRGSPVHQNLEASNPPKPPAPSRTAILGENNPTKRLHITFYHATNDLPAFSDYGMVNRTFRHYTRNPFCLPGRSPAPIRLNLGNLIRHLKPGVATIHPSVQ